MPAFEKTRVLLSFGAAAGGFEFAMQLRKDIMDKYKKTEQTDPYFTYIDAESLRNDVETKYTWDQNLGIYKMSNPCWDTFYKSAMSKCDYMVFLISEPWLKSNWCWDEFNWYQMVLTEKSITPIFVVFKDALSILNGNNKVKDGKGNIHDLKPIWQLMITHKNASTVIINTDPDPGVAKVIVDGATYTYTHKYVCNTQELSAILTKINVKMP
ncbi:MAG: hypothetical protein P4L39_01910 [Humidesulfovibrio sp.]|nr:hypothetical protein [Humidesulfovibrio sp.]